jgi:glycosyltransferase involved in cell wall biosynthesis
MNGTDEENNRIRLRREELARIRTTFPNDVRLVKGFVVSRHFIPSTASRSLTMFKLLSNSNINFTVISQYLSNNRWLYNAESNLWSPNINQIISTSEENWEGYVVENFLTLNKIMKFDFILTCIMPAYDHKMGLEIKMKYPGIPWIALWSDPVAYSPYANKAGDFENVGERRKKEYEKEIFSKADLLIFTNYHQMVYMLADELEKYRGKSLIIHHGFDEKYYPKDKSRNSSDKIVTAYVGHLDEYRNLYELADGLRKSKFSDRFLVKLIGHVPENQLRYIEECGLKEVFTYMGELSWEECLKEMEQCDFLITMDPNYVNMEYSQQMSSKIADYLGSKKPVLFMSYDKGISADIAKETGNRLIWNRKDDIANMMDEIAIFGIWVPLLSAYENYNENRIAAQLDKTINDRFVRKM